MGLMTTSLRTSRAACVRERALQRGRHAQAATKTARVAKEAMAGTGGAGDGRDRRRRGMLDKYPNELRSEGRDAKTTGGALARRGVLVSAGRYARPPSIWPVRKIPNGFSKKRKDVDKPPRVKAHLMPQTRRLEEGAISA